MSDSEQKRPGHTVWGGKWRVVVQREKGRKIYTKLLSQWENYSFDPPPQAASLARTLVFYRLWCDIEKAKKIWFTAGALMLHAVTLVARFSFLRLLFYVVVVPVPPMAGVPHFTFHIILSLLFFTENDVKQQHQENAVFFSWKTLSASIWCDSTDECLGAAYRDRAID